MYSRFFVRTLLSSLLHLSTGKRISATKWNHLSGWFDRILILLTTTNKWMQASLFFVVFDALLAWKCACLCLCETREVPVRFISYWHLWRRMWGWERRSIVLHSNSDQTNFMLLCMENFTAVCSTCTRCDGTVFSGTIVFTFKNAYRTIFLCHIE